MSPSIELRACAFTHQGAVRAANEDTIAVGDWVMSAPMTAPAVFERVVAAPLICLVADGMGGHAAGEVASRAVAERLVAGAARATDAAAMAGLLEDADHALSELMRVRPALRGMGTTVAGVALGPAGCLVFNVGDSRVYRIDDAALRDDHGGRSGAGRPAGRRGEAAARLEQLTTDDTPGPKLADGRTAAMTSHLITQTLGGAYPAAGIEPHLRALPPVARERYLICSDGLSDLLSRAEIEALLTGDDRASIEALFAAAMAAGGRDNVSIVMLDLRRR